MPWIVAELGPLLGAGSRWRARLARSLLSLLKGAEVDLSGVVVVWSGSDLLQIRIPDGTFGSPIYRNSRAAANAIRHFFDDLCSTDEVVRDAIDEKLFSPDCLVPIIGSVYPKNGRRVVGTDGITFLERSRERSFGQPRADRTGQAPRYTQPGDCAPPQRAPFQWGPFLSLDPHRRDPDLKHAGGAQDGREVGHIVRQVYSNYGREPGPGTVRFRDLSRLANGVEQEEKWGTTIDPSYAGQNQAALFVSHDQLRSSESPEEAWRAVKAWNSRNSPPLSKMLLEVIFEEACSNWP